MAEGEGLFSLSEAQIPRKLWFCLQTLAPMLWFSVMHKLSQCFCCNLCNRSFCLFLCFFFVSLLDHAGKTLKLHDITKQLQLRAPRLSLLLFFFKFKCRIKHLHAFVFGTRTANGSKCILKEWDSRTATMDLWLQRQMLQTNLHFQTWMCISEQYLIIGQKNDTISPQLSSSIVACV